MESSVKGCKSNTEPERITDKEYRKEMMNRIRANQSGEMKKFLEENTVERGYWNQKLGVYVFR
jgi:hypothetical protein